MRDGPVRRAVKLATRCVFFLNLWCDRGLRRLRGERRPYDLGGECRRCAACCEAPAIRVHALVWLAPRLRRAFLWWHERVNGFVLVESRARERTFVFRCTHFDRATRSCDSYSSRPGLCRDYPRAQLHQPSPELLPGCGYRPLSRRRVELEATLRRASLTEDQLGRLRRGLHLDEPDDERRQP